MNENPPIDPPERYVLDAKTLEELTALFTWAQITVDAQMDDETAEDMQMLLEELSDKFGLQYTTTDIKVDKDTEEDGSITYKIKLDPVVHPPKPALVWTNDQPKVKGLKIVDKDYQEPSNDDDDPEPPKLA